MSKVSYWSRIVSRVSGGRIFMFWRVFEVRVPLKFSYNRQGMKKGLFKVDFLKEGNLKK